MIDKLRSNITHFADTHKIHILLVSIIILVFLPPFLTELPNFTDSFIKLDFLMILIACYLIIRKVKSSRFIGYITFILIIIDAFLESDILNYIGQLGISYMVIHAFTLVLKEAMSLQGDTKNLILVSITGYLIIGLIGGFLSAGLEYIYPNSYSHSADIVFDLYTFIYYSFVTMTTLGYGDMIPITQKAQALALMMVISGQLFLSVIIAINIAKFMQKKKPNV
ncbi:hypothetical protein LCM02_04035 [Lutimonas saemankumensis]|uniref:ion channel n=1 Tax=Lutimonas saemankumensis TaxID=483016 RepID=UPI001CD697D3|nr:ion channel [Lutimonas saemankumensis]MCA0931610.1 hypothetical protein [Lutimonas saemankumensis]